MIKQVGDQTLFADEEPLFENPVELPVEEDSDLFLQEKKRKKIIILSVSSAVSLVIVGLVLAFTMSKPEEQPANLTPEVTEEVVESELTKIEKLVKEANQAVDEAESTRDQLLPPPVDYDFEPLDTR